MEATFGPALRSERKRLGQSLRQFAEFVGTSVSTLKRWESGQASPPEAQRESLFDLIQGTQRAEPETDGIHFGWMLKIERIAATCSIRQAAELSLIPPSAWHRYETGQSRLGRNQAKRLVSHLRPNPDQIPPNPKPQTLNPADCPLAVARTLVTHLLNADPCESRYEAFRTLALALMHIGEHNLCGLAYRLSARYGIEEGIPENDIKVAQISSGWRGFPEITNREVAANRLRWMDKKIASLPTDRQLECATMRSMFIDWAGYPQLAAEVLRHASGEGLSALSLAWIEAKYGQPHLAVSLAEPFLEHENSSYRFIANKVLLESHLGMDDLEAAKEHMTRLLELRSSRGFWSPDLTAKQKRLASTPL